MQCVQFKGKRNKILNIVIQQFKMKQEIFEYKEEAMPAERVSLHFSSVTRETHRIKVLWCHTEL